jgi:hypothetical protein
MMALIVDTRFVQDAEDKIISQQLLEYTLQQITALTAI